MQMYRYLTGSSAEEDEGDAGSDKAPTLSLGIEDHKLTLFRKRSIAENMGWFSGGKKPLGQRQVHILLAPSWSGKTYYMTSNRNKLCHNIYDADDLFAEMLPGNRLEAVRLQQRFPGKALGDLVCSQSGDCITADLGLINQIRKRTVDGPAVQIYMSKYFDSATADLYMQFGAKSVSYMVPDESVAWLWGINKSEVQPQALSAPRERAEGHRAVTTVASSQRRRVYRSVESYLEGMRLAFTPNVKSGGSSLPPGLAVRTAVSTSATAVRGFEDTQTAAVADAPGVYFGRASVCFILAPPFSGKSTWVRKAEHALAVYDADRLIYAKMAAIAGGESALKRLYPIVDFDAMLEPFFGHGASWDLVVAEIVRSVFSAMPVNVVVLSPHFSTNTKVTYLGMGARAVLYVVPEPMSTLEWSRVRDSADPYAKLGYRETKHSELRKNLKAAGQIVHRNFDECVATLTTGGFTVSPSALPSGLVRAHEAYLDNVVQTQSIGASQVVTSKNEAVAAVPTAVVNPTVERTVPEVGRSPAASELTSAAVEVMPIVKIEQVDLTSVLGSAQDVLSATPLEADGQSTKEEDRQVDAVVEAATDVAVVAEVIPVTASASTGRKFNRRRRSDSRPKYLDEVTKPVDSNPILTEVKAASSVARPDVQESSDKVEVRAPGALQSAEFSGDAADESATAAPPKDEGSGHGASEAFDAADLTAPSEDERELSPGDQPVIFDAARIELIMGSKPPVELHQPKYDSYSEVYPDTGSTASPTSTAEYMGRLFPENDTEMLSVTEGYDNETEWHEMVEISVGKRKIKEVNWMDEGRRWVQTEFVSLGEDAPGYHEINNAVAWLRDNDPAFLSNVREKSGLTSPEYINWLRGCWEHGQIPTTVYWGLLPPGALEKLPKKEEIVISGKDKWIEWVELVQTHEGKYNPQLAAEVYAALKNTKSDKINEIALRWHFAHTTAAKKANLTLKNLLDKVRTDSNDGLKRIVSSLLGFHGARHTEKRIQANSFLVAIIAWIFGNTLRSDLFMQVLGTGIFAVQRDNWSEVAKAMHELVHSSMTFLGQRLTPDEASQLMYFDILYGRSGVTPDWAEARIARARVPKSKVAYDAKKQQWSSETWQLVRDRKLYEIIAPAIAKAASKGIPSLREWVAERYKYGAGGTASGLPARYKRKRVGDIFSDTFVFGASDLEERMNWLKKGVLEHDDMLEWMERRLQGLDNGMSEDVAARVKQAIGELPEVYNVVAAAGKPEELGDKVRELYASYMVDYLLQNYVLSVFEKLIDHPDVDLGSADDGQITRDLEIISENGKDFKLCWDYSDFNAQHTGEDLQAFFSVVSSAARDYKAPTQFGDVARWVGATMLNTVIVFPDPKVMPVLVHHTLMSGWRGTTVLNTVLNACYLEAVEHSYHDYYAIKSPLLIFRKANGDDVIARVSNWGQGFAFLELAEKVGLEGKMIKQRLDQTDGEYLRVSYYKNLEARTSLCRGLSTLVTGNWIGTGHADLLGKKEQIAEQLALMRRRGLSNEVSWLCEKILRKQHLVIKTTDGLAKGGIVFAPSGTGKTSFINMHNGKLGGIHLVDGDKYVDWSSAMRDKHTLYEAAGLINAWLDFERDDKFVLFVHPCATALGLDKVPTIMCIPTASELKRNLADRQRKHRYTTSLEPKGLRQSAYTFALMRGINITSTLYDAYNAIAQQLDSTYRMHLRLPDWLHRVSKASNGWGTSGVMLLRDDLPAYPGIEKHAPTLADDTPKDMSAREVENLQREMFAKGFGVVEPGELTTKLAQANYMSSLNNSLNSKLERENLTSAVKWWLRVAQTRPVVEEIEYRALNEQAKHLVSMAVQKIEEATVTGELQTASYIGNEVSKGQRYTRYVGHIVRIGSVAEAKLVELAGIDSSKLGLTPELMEALLADQWADQAATADIPANWKPEIRNVAMEIYREAYGIPENINAYNYVVSGIMAQLSAEVFASDQLKLLTRY